MRPLSLPVAAVLPKAAEQVDLCRWGSTAQVPGATYGRRKVLGQACSGSHMRPDPPRVKFSYAPLIHPEICSDFVVHVSHQACAFSDGDLAFCEWLAVQVDNSVIETKPALTSDHRNETTPCVFGGRPYGAGAKRLGFQKLAASSLKRGGLDRSAPTSLISEIWDRFVRKRTANTQFVHNLLVLWG